MGADSVLDGSWVDGLFACEEESAVELVGVSASMTGVVAALEGIVDFPWSSGGKERNGRETLR